MTWSKRRDIMLCQPLDERNLNRNFASSPYLLVQPKLDGIRCWVQWWDDQPFLVSSEGHDIDGVPHINLLLQDWAKALDEKLSFDGELYCPKMPFEDIVSICKRKSTNLRHDYTSIEYHIFDIKIFDETNRMRQEKLRQCFDLMPRKVIRPDIFQLVPTYEVRTKDEVDHYLDLFMEAGYEGIIVRNALAYYVEKRPWTILKWKPGKEDIYLIKEVEEAISETGSPLGRCGSLVCTDRFGNEFRVGSGRGMTHIKLKEMWDNREMWKGRNVLVQYQNLTANGVPRFGKFLSLTDKEEVHV